jgi:membrane protease YdiL (CAAX protease family)
MIGIVIELLISFLLLKWLMRQDLLALGLAPNKSRGFQLLVGLLWPIAFMCSFQYLVSIAVHNPYEVNRNYTVFSFLKSTGYVFKAVAFEELLFRGALLYILIKKAGSQKALIISALAFGIYHWFSWQLFGNWAQMLLVLTTTGLAGYVFALAFERTGSMYLPFALHFGYNFSSMVLFSQDNNIGPQLFVKAYQVDPYSPGAVVSICVIIIHFIGFPLLTYLFLRKNKRLTV